MLKKLLDIAKKPTGFFLELDEEKLSQEEAKSPIVFKSPRSESESTEEDRQTQSKATPSKINKMKSQKNRKEAGQIATESMVEKAPKPLRVDDPVTQLIVNAVSAKKLGEEDIAKNFATDYLIASPIPNRRPSVSMNKFKEMSRRMKNTTANIKPKRVKQSFSS